MPNYTRIPVEERLWSKVDRSDPDACWIWTGWRDKTGYGQTSRPGQGAPTVAAHRVAFELTYGEIPPGHEIDHICHVRACINPRHLRLATHKQNQENVPGADRINNTSGVRGVSWNIERQKYEAKVQHNGVTHHAGTFVNLVDAADAARRLRLKLFTHSQN